MTALRGSTAANELMTIEQQQGRILDVIFKKNTWNVSDDSLLFGKSGLGPTPSETLSEPSASLNTLKVAIFGVAR